MDQSKPFLDHARDRATQKATTEVRRRRHRRPTVAAALVATAMLLGACGSDDDGGATATTAADDTSTTSTTAYLGDATSSALVEDAVTFGNTFLDGDATTLRPLMTQRCQGIMTEAKTEVMLRLVLAVMERQQDVDAAEVTVESALAGPIDGTDGEAALVLNADVFEDPDFAFLQMQPYVYEDDAWRFDGCDTLKVNLDGQ